MAWIGLTVGLLSALVASLAALEYDPSTRLWSCAFFLRNRFKMLSAFLATIGFLVAGISLRTHSLASEAARQRVELENNELKALLLSGKHVEPQISIVIQPAKPFNTATANASDQEDFAWQSSGRPKRLPRPIGFVPSAIRMDLFPDAKTTPIFGSLGTVSLRLGPGIEIQFWVRQRGSAIWGPLGNLPIAQFQADVYAARGDHSESAIAFTFQVPRPIDALHLFYDLIRAYKEKQTPLEIRSNGPCVRTNRLRLARISVSLDENDEIDATALLREEPIECGRVRANLVWRFTGAPTLSVTQPGGSL